MVLANGARLRRRLSAAGSPADGVVVHVPGSEAELEIAVDGPHMRAVEADGFGQILSTSAQMTLVSV
jgi:hypothetical protein